LRWDEREKSWQKIFGKSKKVIRGWQLRKRSDRQTAMIGSKATGKCVRAATMPSLSKAVAMLEKARELRSYYSSIEAMHVLTPQRFYMVIHKPDVSFIVRSADLSLRGHEVRDWKVARRVVCKFNDERTESVKTWSFDNDWHVQDFDYVANGFGRGWDGSQRRRQVRE
jgi:hypothetical protein